MAPTTQPSKSEKMRRSKAILVPILLSARVSGWSKGLSKHHHHFNALYSRRTGILPNFHHVRTTMLYSTNIQDSVQLSNTTTGNNNNPPNKQKTGLSCQHCSQTFASRNSLFRHLKKDPKCSLLAASGTDIALTRQSIALLFGYSDNGTFGESSSSSSTVGLVENLQDSDWSQATQARMVLSNATLRAVEHVAEKHFNMTKANSSTNDKIQLITATQSSTARMRHRSVAQEAGCAAARDVFCANLLAPELMNTDLWSQVLERIQEELLSETNPKIQVERMKIMDPSEIKLHAERGCTQRIYHYLLPLSWLPDGDILQQWWKSGDEVLQSNKSMKKAQKPPESLRRFKAALRSAESSVQVLDDVNVVVLDDQNLRTAGGRFGALGNRERRPWHNYADPELRGDASPSIEPVFRVVDRARIVDFLMDDGPNGGEVVAVLEFKGDAFLRQQVRHIVGTAVAMTHEWLPDDFVDKSTRADTFVETPIAPPGRLYNAGSRFHFAEMRTKGRPLFDSNLGGSVITGSKAVNGIEWIQKLLLENKAVEDEDAATSEKKWLDDLKTIVAPRIQAQLASSQDHPPEPLSADQVGNYPKSYESVLTELRKIIISGRWPETTVARSTVIRSVERTGEIRRNGSFTVVNPAALDADRSGLPLGNELFPKLAQAIFDLEEDMSKETRDRLTVESLEHGILVERAPSTHCAVNCNAEFTPHVDSGKGTGQSLSMIVGLGDYAGGELFVEGKMFDIRYKPIEFDGWKLRHWTNRFNGERFSLVWFTPEVKSKK